MRSRRAKTTRRSLWPSSSPGCSASGSGSFSLTGLEGEQLARRRRGLGCAAPRARPSRRPALRGLCGAAGFAPGFFIGYTDADSLFDESTDWPAWLSIGMLVLLIGTAVISGLLAQRSYDEHQKMTLYKSISFAAAAYFLSYPAWFFLWKGDFLPEPMHGALFGIFYVGFILGFIYYRFKS